MSESCATASEPAGSEAVHDSIGPFAVRLRSATMAEKLRCSRTGRRSATMHDLESSLTGAAAAPGSTSNSKDLALAEAFSLEDRDVLATRLTQSEINMLEESRRMRGKRLRIKTKQALNATPTAVALVLVFPVFLGIMMAFVVPLFKVYREKGIAANSATFQGWLSCNTSAAAAATATPHNSTFSASRPVRTLVQYKGLPAGKLGQDYEEADLRVGLGGAVPPVPDCPAVEEDGSTAVADQPYAKVSFTFSRINAEELLATVDIRVELINSLDAEANSFLNSTGGQLTLVLSPAITGTDELTLKWTDAKREWPGLSMSLRADNPLTEYPWDVYSLERGLVAELLVYNTTKYPQTKLLPIQVYTQVTTQLFDITVSTGANKMLKGVNPALPIHVLVRRTVFTKAYAVLVVVLLWFVGGLNLIHITDNIFVRPREIKDAFAPMLLWALPGFRNTMPGIPQAMGLAIDMIGLVWAELMIAICVVVSFVAFIGQYHHPARLFRRIKSDASEAD